MLGSVSPEDGLEPEEAGFGEVALLKEPPAPAGGAPLGDMMKNAALIERLISLARLDYDVMCAYEEAIRRIDKNDRDVREHLIQYRNAHAIHVNALSTAIVDLGGSVPALSPEARGNTSQGVVSLTNASGTTAALQALRQNEIFIEKAYDSARSDPEFSDYPFDLQEHFKNFLVDEEQHLSYIDSALKFLAAAVR